METKVARNSEMKKLRDDGKTLQEIADAFGVSAVRVFQIIGSTGWVKHAPIKEPRKAKVEKVKVETESKKRGPKRSESKASRIQEQLRIREETGRYYATRKKEMISLRQKGWTVRDIAKKCGITYQRVSVILDEGDIWEDRIRRIREDYGLGYTGREIAKRQSVATSTVSKYISDLIQDETIEKKRILKRCLQKVSVTKSGCWEVNEKNYRPRIRMKGKTIFLYRFVWEMMRHKIPAGMLICHKCNNQKCINPDHLYVGTQADNVRDREEARMLRLKGLTSQKY